MNGGDLSLDAQSSVFSVASNQTSTDTSTWSNDCQASNCGVLIYNTSGTSGMGQISVSAGAALELRPYTAAHDGAGLNWSDYQTCSSGRTGRRCRRARTANPRCL